MLRSFCRVGQPETAHAMPATPVANLFLMVFLSFVPSVLVFDADSLVELVLDHPRPVCWVGTPR
jgi:hypothetical protein